MGRDQATGRIRTPHSSEDKGVREEALSGEAIVTADSCVALGVERVEQGTDDQGVRPD